MVIKRLWASSDEVSVWSASYTPHVIRPNLPPVTDPCKWRSIEPARQDVESVLTRKVDLRFIDTIGGRNFHRYFLDGDMRNVCSMTTVIKYLIPSTFEQNKYFIAKRCIGSRNPRYKDCKTVNDVYANWDQVAIDGTYYHSLYEKYLQVGHVFGSPLTVEPKVGFLRMLEDHPFLEPVFVELKVVWPEMRWTGTIDAILRDKRNGELLLCEHKNFVGLTTKGRSVAGAKIPYANDSKLFKTTVQLNGYATILTYGPYIDMLKNITRFVGVNYPADNYNVYEMFNCPLIENFVDYVREILPLTHENDIPDEEALFDLIVAKHSDIVF